jgi:hypothetical protein
MDGSAWDVESMFAAYLGGDSLAEIGRRESVSAEWVRQLFRDAGFPAAAEAHTTRQRSRDRRADLRQPLLSSFTTSGSVRAAAEEAGCSERLASEILAAEGIEVGHAYAWMRNKSRPRMSAEFCRQVLADAARRCGGRVSLKQYTELFKGGATTAGKRWPAPNNLEHRMGVRTWNEALMAAGVPLVSAGPGVRGPSDADLITHLVQLGHQMGRPPSPKEWEEARQSNGMPGAQAVRHRFGTWAGFIKAAGL